MTPVTLTQVNKARKGLEEITREAKRKLFEFETLTHLYEISMGKISRYRTARAFMRSLAK